MLPAPMIAAWTLTFALPQTASAPQSAPAPSDDLAATARQLPRAEAWLAAKGAKGFRFRRAPGGKATAWFETIAREDPKQETLGHYALALVDRPDGTVRTVDLSADVKRADTLVGPVWSADGARLAVGFETAADHSGTAHVLVVDAQTGQAIPWLTEPGALVTSLNWSQDGTQLALTVNEGWSRVLEEGRDAFSFRVLKGADQVAWRGTIPDEHGFGAAVALSPDGHRVLAMSRNGVFLFEAGKPGNTRLGDVQPDATIFSTPQWSADGSRAVAVAGGAVTFVDLRARSVRCVGEKQLRGRAFEVAWVPGTPHALALVQQVGDGSADEVRLGAGHARQRYSSVPVLVSALSGAPRTLDALRKATPAGVNPNLEYLPQVTEALSLWLR